MVMALALVVSGCGDDDDNDSNKNQNSQVTSNNNNDAQREIIDSLLFTGVIENINLNEYQFLGPIDFSGILEGEQRIEKLEIRIGQNGIIEQGIIIIEGRDSIGLFTYRAECNANQGRQCGTINQRGISIDLYDGIGHISLRSQTVILADNNNNTNFQILSGDITIDNHPVQSQRLGTFRLEEIR